MAKALEIIRNAKFITTLPASEYPWQIIVMNATVYVVNQEHAPMMLDDQAGKLVPVDWT